MQQLVRLGIGKLSSRASTIEHRPRPAALPLQERWQQPELQLQENQENQEQVEDERQQEQECRSQSSAGAQPERVPDGEPEDEEAKPSARPHRAHGARAR